MASCIIRVEIETSAYKKVACCLMFPGDYPRSLILVELKSKTLADRLLTGLTRVAEEEARKFLGRPQVTLTINVPFGPKKVEIFWAHPLQMPRVIDLSASKTLSISSI